MNASRHVTNEQEKYHNATSEVTTDDGPDILSTHTESCCNVTLLPELNQIIEAMNDDQPSRAEFETLPDPVQNTACSNNVEGDKVKGSCSSTSGKQTMGDADTFSSTLAQSVKYCQQFEEKYDKLCNATADSHTQSSDAEEEEDEEHGTISCDVC